MAYTNAEIDGQTVPILISSPRPKVAPPILSGHDLDANDQVVLGAATLAVLHKHVGDTVMLGVGTPKDAPHLHPTDPAADRRHRDISCGGLLQFRVRPHLHGHRGSGPHRAHSCRFNRAINSPDPILNGPALVFVRLRTGVSAAAGRASLQRIAEAANKVLAADPNAAGNNVTVLGVQRPVQIVNYRSIGSTPVILAVGLASGRSWRSRSPLWHRSGTADGTWPC